MLISFARIGYASVIFTGRHANLCVTWRTITGSPGRRRGSNVQRDACLNRTLKVIFGATVEYFNIVSGES